MLYSPLSIKEMELPNRIIRSATGEGVSTDDGFVTATLERVMMDLARGGVGLIITGHMFVNEQGRSDERQLGIHTDECIEGLRGMTDRIHRESGLVVAQLAHAGGQAAQQYTHLPALGPSPFIRYDGESCNGMNARDIAIVIKGFGKAARRAVEAGFDGVQIHGAHGYCLSQFLSPAITKREDEYGGSFENRVRLLVQVYDAVRDAVGADFPVLLKINCEDFVEGGLAVEESIKAVKMLELRGLDGVEVSGGLRANGPTTIPARVGRFNTPEKQAWYKSAVRQLKDTVAIPVILVGGVRSMDVCEALLSEGIVDAIALCRPLIREPGLANRWASGDTRPAECLNCNKCFGVVFDDVEFFCPVARKEGE